MGHFGITVELLHNYMYDSCSTISFRSHVKSVKSTTQFEIGQCFDSYARIQKMTLIVQIESPKQLSGLTSVQFFGVTWMRTDVCT